jgi:glycosyltransferase involved in cell wall biosynthesis
MSEPAPSTRTVTPSRTPSDRFRILAPRGLRVINVGLFPPPFGGIAIHLQRLLDRLQAAGVDCLIVDLSGRPKRQAGVATWTWLGTIVRLLLAPRSIVHFHNFSPRNTFFFWLLSFRHATILSLHNERFLDQLDQGGSLAHKLAKAFLGRIDRIVVNSQKSQRLARPIVKEPSRMVLIPEFLEPAGVPPLTNPDVIRIRANHRFLLTSNAFRLAFHKGADLYGLDHLVELVRRLVHQRKLDVALAFLLPEAGSTTYFESIRGEVARLGLADRVLFVTEPLEEAASLWQAGDVFVRATNTDGNSLSVMEALSVGTPVVASDCVDRPEGVVTFATRDIDDLEAKVVDVLSRLDEHRRRVAMVEGLDNGGRFLELYASMGMRPGT